MNPMNTIGTHLLIYLLTYLLTYVHIRDHHYLEENDETRLNFRISRVSAPPSPVTSAKKSVSPKATPSKVFISLTHSLTYLLTYLLTRSQTPSKQSLLSSPLDNVNNLYYKKNNGNKFRHPIETREILLFYHCWYLKSISQDSSDVREGTPLTYSRIDPLTHLLTYLLTHLL